MNRYGVPTAPEGCGDDLETGPCETCSQHALRKGAWMIRQLLPLKYSTYYFTGGNPSGEMGGEDDQTFVNIAFWRMWFGKVFDHESHRWEIKASA